MILCPVCQAELEPYIVEDMAGHKVHWTLRYRKDEPVFSCPNVVRGDGHGMNLWTASNIKSYPAKQKKLEKFKVRY